MLALPRINRAKIKVSPLVVIGFRQTESALFLVSSLSLCGQSFSKLNTHCHASLCYSIICNINNVRLPDTRGIYQRFAYAGTESQSKESGRMEKRGKSQLRGVQADVPPLKTKALDCKLFLYLICDYYYSFILLYIGG